MHPVLFSFRCFGLEGEVRSFALLVALGCLAGIVYAVRAAPRAGVDPIAMRDLCAAVLLVSIFGAHLTYVATQGRLFWDGCLDAASDDNWRAAIAACGAPLWFWQGGLVFYGGVLSGLVTTIVFARRRRLPFGRLADLLSPSLAIGHAIGRLGCYAAGCCWGKPAVGLASAWAARFPPSSAVYQDLAAHHALEVLDAASARTPPLHPTQLYEAAFELALFALLVVLQRRTRRVGTIALVYVAAYSSMRVLVEVFRGDAPRRFVVALSTPRLNALLGLPVAEPSFVSTSQALGLLALFACATLALVQRRRATSLPLARDEGSATRAR